MRRQELEITLSRTIKSFHNPKIELEQYQTPSRVAANLLHRANELGDIFDKKVLDVCSGTGILGIGASLLGASVSCIEIDSDAISILKTNAAELDIVLQTYHEDILTSTHLQLVDTIVSNPPFGIQQKKFKDLDFVRKGMEFGKIGYFILDGSQANFTKVPKLLAQDNLKVIEIYRDEFPLANHYPWHKNRLKLHNVMIIRVIHN